MLFRFFFFTDMSSGHFSASDRYKYMKEQAFEYAFVLETLNCSKLVKPTTNGSVKGVGKAKL